MAILISDSFNRADSTMTLGSSDGSGTRDPTTWAYFDGFTFSPVTNGWGINSDQAYTPAIAGYPRTPIAVVDAGVADVLEKVTVVVRSNQCGVIFRFQDALDYWYWLSWSTSPQIFLAKVIGGTPTTVHTWANDAFANNERVGVQCNGSTINLYRNGDFTSPIYTTTDSTFVANTKFGLLTQRELASGNGGDAGVRFDDFEIDTLTGPGWYVNQIAMST